VRLQLVHDGWAGPEVRINLTNASPALFHLTASTAISTRPDGSVITRDTPAKAGDIITLYATGLGRTVPDLWWGELATSATWLKDIQQFNVFLNGSQVDRNHILYAGLAPGFAGLYQVNLRLPDNVPPNPEIRLAVGTELSPAGIIIPVQGQ
jgi:uncharacterized protein (TIGR03437 family)